MIFIFLAEISDGDGKKNYLFMNVFSATYQMNGNFTRDMILLQRIKMDFRHSTYLAKCIRYDTFC